MDERHPAERVEHQLFLYLETHEASKSEEILSEILTEVVEPIVKKVVRYRLGVFLNGSSERPPERDAEDLCSEITLRSLIRLRQLKSEAGGSPIRNLSGYIANLAHQFCSDYFRQKHPERWRLKTKLRYVLSHRSQFAIWKDEREEWVCGFSNMKGQPAVRSSSIAEAVLRKEFEKRRPTAKEDLTDLLDRIFQSAGNSLELDMVLMICWELIGTKGVKEEDVREIASSERSVLQIMEQQSYLQRLWKEARQLPSQQIQALLLSIRDSDGLSLLPVIPAAGIASLNEISDLLKVEHRELLELWDQLPLEDIVIAERLGVSRQQVINLRKSARERLTRRMRME